MGVLLVAADGATLRVGPGGVLVGRGADCDLVVPDPEVSRRQVLVRAGPAGAEVIPMGRSPVRVDGQAVVSATPVRAGAVLQVGGASFRVAVEGPEARPLGWMLRTGGGTLFGLPRLPYTMGAGQDGGLSVPGWTVPVARLHAGDERLLVEVLAEADVDGAAAEPGGLRPAGHGTRIAHAGAEVVLLGADPASAARTAAGTPRRAVLGAGLEVLPQGGRVTWVFADGDLVVYLPGNRFALLAALLNPRRASREVDDATLCRQVWGSVREPAQVNLLIHRARLDLTEAGLDGLHLIQRRGGATWVELAEGARVWVEDAGA